MDGWWWVKKKGGGDKAAVVGCRLDLLIRSFMS